MKTITIGIAPEYVLNKKIQETISLFKKCPSSNCRLDKGVMFIASRENQKYCSTTCRNYHNVKLFRKKGDSK